MDVECQPKNAFPSVVMAWYHLCTCRAMHPSNVVVLGEKFTRHESFLGETILIWQVQHAVCKHLHCRAHNHVRRPSHSGSVPLSCPFLQGAVLPRLLHIAWTHRKHPRANTSCMRHPTQH